MKEHPLLMKGPLVRATLEGRKTQTRRPIKPQPDDDIVDVEYDAIADLWLGNTQADNDLGYTSSWAMRCPMGQAGDRLWVRETFQAWRKVGHESDEWEPIGVKAASFGDTIEYRATSKSTGPWTPSIHMPRWACRLVLPLVSVRVERVQDITEEDAKAEGVEPVLMRGIGSYPEWMRPTMRGGHQKAFELLWKQIYGDALWDANPWVWVAEWKEIEVSK